MREVDASVSSPLIFGLITGSTINRVEVAGDDVRFVPEQTSALPSWFQAPVWKLGVLPLVTCLRDIEVLPGLVRITCSTDNPPADFPPGPS